MWGLSFTQSWAESLLPFSVNTRSLSPSGSVRFIHRVPHSEDLYPWQGDVEEGGGGVCGEDMYNCSVGGDTRQDTDISVQNSNDRSCPQYNNIAYQEAGEPHMSPGEGEESNTWNVISKSYWPLSVSKMIFWRRSLEEFKWRWVVTTEMGPDLFWVFFLSPTYIWL